MRVPLAALALWSVSACGSPGTGDATASTTTIGADPVSAAIVAQVARAGRISNSQAATMLAEDTRFARALEERAPDVSAYLRRVALARGLSLRIIRGARDQGPANDEELDRFTRRHWWELDRPTASRSTHAVVRVGKGEDRTGARLVANGLRRALEGIRSKEQFTAIASSYDSGGFELAVEDLQPVTTDGRVFNPDQPPRPGSRGQRYALAFAQAVNAIEREGEISDVIETSFGFHVILLTERLPEMRVGVEERRRTLRTEIESVRAREVERGVVDAARASTEIEIDSAALAHTEGLYLGP